MRRFAVFPLLPLSFAGCLRAVVPLRDLLQMLFPSSLSARLRALRVRLLACVTHSPHPFRFLRLFAREAEEAKDLAG